MKLGCICFSPAGQSLARTVLPKLGEDWETDIECGYGPEKRELSKWAGEMFAEADALLFIGAAGIAIRAVAPFVTSKLQDPAVVVMDEAGRYVISLLSGHIGGANRLASHLAELSGGQAVITTGTDVRGVLALDAWATENDMVILNPEKIKDLSARMLRGDMVALYSDAPLEGPAPKEVSLTDTPERADVIVSYRAHPDFRGLHLVPRCITLGVGCRQKATADTIREVFMETVEATGILPSAVYGVYSIDIKAREPGLLAFCELLGVPLRTYSAAQLNAVTGAVSRSDFVKSVTGADNVCERAALAGGGKLLVPKTARDGITVALALKELSYSFGGRK